MHVNIFKDEHFLHCFTRRDFIILFSYGNCKKKYMYIVSKSNFPPFLLGFGAPPSFGGTPGFGSQAAFGSSPSFGSAPAFGGGSTFGGGSSFQNQLGSPQNTGGGGGFAG